jgi:hypothetical protein
MAALSSSQRSTLGACLLLVLLACAFPPWVEVYNSSSGQSSTPLGYSFLFDPPPATRSSSKIGVEIDVSRFLVQLLGATVIAGIGMLFGTSTKPVRMWEWPPGLAIVAGSTAGVLLWGLDFDASGWVLAAVLGLAFWRGRAILRALQRHGARLGYGPIGISLVAALFVTRDGLPGYIGSVLGIYGMSYLVSYAFMRKSDKAIRIAFTLWAITNVAMVLVVRSRVLINE